MSSLYKKLHRPRIMGILNITPDSFFDGGKFFNIHKAVRRAEEMIHEGVDIIDAGGESTGPGSRFVEEEEELARVIPVIQKTAPMAHKKGILISIDTYKAEVAKQAVSAGADIVNDVTALRGHAAFRGDVPMARFIAESGTKIVLMYSKDATPRTTRGKVRYKDVVKIIKRFLKRRVAFAQACGIKKSQIILDPGMGAFVSAVPKYSFEILRRLGELKKLGFPILIGPSRKSFLGGKQEDRLIGSVMAALMAIHNGADIVRVHDVKETAKMRDNLFWIKTR